MSGSISFDGNLSTRVPTRRLTFSYEEGASGAGGAAAGETSSDEVAAALADAALEVVGAERAGDGDGELKELMKKLAGDLKAEKAGETSLR